jgi:ABC-2 type transport system ATP-binding protein
MLEVRNLTKRYSGITVVDQVSFIIRPGEILGYLGANGAGKSTTVKMLTGLIEPSAGEILFNGENVVRDMKGFQRRIGYVAEEAHLYPHLTGREYLQLAGRLRGIRREVLEPKLDELIQLFGLWEDRHSHLSSYSKGMRQKILLSAALLHDPELLILDEPFSGLDVNAALVLRALMRALAERNKIVLYSSHVLEVVEKVASSVLILRKGKVAAHDSVANLQNLMAQESLEGVFSQLTQTGDPAQVAQRIIETVAMQ